jgi:8-oxo-dGTP pyrophosphatase MutT (NUDIX family)
MKPESPSGPLQPWRTLRSQPEGDFKIFRIRTDRVLSPRTQEEHDFFVIESVNWVNVVALTPDRQVVMIEQYRHGSGTVELEIPGGMIDPSDTSPEAAGQRELREETGYAGENARRIGELFPNPAIMGNTLYIVLVETCRCVHPVQFDHSEDLITRLVPVDSVPELVRTGRIRHSLVIAGLYQFELWRRQKA